MKEIKIDDLVRWKCSPYNEEPFIAEGVVRGWKKTTFGSVVKAIGVWIEPIGLYKDFFPNRKTTFIAIHNLKKGGLIE